MVDISDVEAAALRIAGHIRRTPLVRADQCAEPASDAELWLKLESCSRRARSRRAERPTS